MGAATDAATNVRLVISSDVRLVDLVHSAAEQIAALVGFDADESLNVGIAVREAVINAITHGNGRDPARSVDIALEARPEGFRATVRDQGLGFDPATTPDPTSRENLLAPTGRGLLMVRAFVDEVEFRYREGLGMEVTLTKHAPPGARR
jgi:serine/threonine-protein kinase RsbW